MLDNAEFTPHGKHLIAGEWVAGEATFRTDPAHVQSQAATQAIADGTRLLRIDRRVSLQDFDGGFKAKSCFRQIRQQSLHEALGVLGMFGLTARSVHIESEGRESGRR